jgi:hypothetical protein
MVTIGKSVPNERVTNAPKHLVQLQNEKSLESLTIQGFK